MKKVFLTFLATISLAALASCGGGKSKLSIFLYQENVIYSSDMDVYKAANEYADIQLEGILQKFDTNYDSIYNLRGKDANLVVNDQDTVESSALKDEIFIDLTALIAEHAPNLTKFFNDNPEQKAWATAVDGKIYGIPFYTAGKSAKAFFVRQDWVNKLATANKLPSGVDKDKLDTLTVVQFESLLEAFKNNKSLLTSADNIYPYFDKDTDWAISELASLWGGTTEYYLDDNNKVVYGATQDEFREAMVNMARWYKKGLIDPNIMTKGTEDKRVTMFSQNSGGSTHDWVGTTYSFNDDVYSENLAEGFKLTCILPPERKDGTRYEPTIRKEIGRVTAINKTTSAEDQVKLIKWIDYFFSDKGKEQLNFGIENVHFTKENNNYKFTDKIINDRKTALANLYAIGCQMQTPGVQNYAYEEAWLSADAKAAMKKYEPIVNQKYNDLIFPNIKLTNEDYQKVNTARSTINDKLQDQINKWLKGTEAINDASFNKFKESMVKAGTNIVTETIQKYVKK